MEVEKPEAYLTRMKLPKQYGDESCLAAISILIGYPLHVYMIWNGVHGQVMVYRPSGCENRTPLLIPFINNIHYELFMIDVEKVAVGVLEVSDSESVDLMDLDVEVFFFLTSRLLLQIP